MKAVVLDLFSPSGPCSPVFTHGLFLVSCGVQPPARNLGYLISSPRRRGHARPLACGPLLGLLVVLVLQLLMALHIAGDGGLASKWLGSGLRLYGEGGSSALPTLDLEYSPLGHLLLQPAFPLLPESSLAVGDIPSFALPHG